MIRHKSTYTFPKASLKKQIMANLVKEQTNRLVEYAKEKIKTFGATKKFEGWEDSGNLLDSLCWGVWYKNHRVQSGYYRNAQATEDSYLHEFSKSMRTKVNGRALAQTFLNTYKPETDGWVVVFGALAPYWGYWELGHHNIIFGERVKFEAMARIYDEVRSELLPPCKVTLEVTVPKY